MSLLLCLESRVCNRLALPPCTATAIPRLFACDEGGGKAKLNFVLAIWKVTFLLKSHLRGRECQKRPLPLSMITKGKIRDFLTKDVTGKLFPDPKSWPCSGTFSFCQRSGYSEHAIPFLCRKKSSPGWLARAAVAGVDGIPSWPSLPGGRPSVYNAVQVVQLWWNSCRTLVDWAQRENWRGCHQSFCLSQAPWSLQRDWRLSSGTGGRFFSHLKLHHNSPSNSIQQNIWDFVMARHSAARQIDILSQNTLTPTFRSHHSTRNFDTKNRLKNRPRDRKRSVNPLQKSRGALQSSEQKRIVTSKTRGMAFCPSSSCVVKSCWDRTAFSLLEKQALRSPTKVNECNRVVVCDVIT